MQKVVTSTAASTDSLYIAGESASSISFPTRAQSTGVLGWTQTRETQRLTNEIVQEVGTRAPLVYMFAKAAPF
jgi:hypothetical protein